MTPLDFWQILVTTGSLVAFLLSDQRQTPSLTVQRLHYWPSFVNKRTITTCRSKSRLWSRATTGNRPLVPELPFRAVESVELSFFPSWKSPPWPPELSHECPHPRVWPHHPRHGDAVRSAEDEEEAGATSRQGMALRQSHLLCPKAS